MFTTIRLDLSALYFVRCWISADGLDIDSARCGGKRVAVEEICEAEELTEAGLVAALVAAHAAVELAAREENELATSEAA
jgi:hypothetical protein